MSKIDEILKQLGVVAKTPAKKSDDDDEDDNSFFGNNNASHSSGSNTVVVGGAGNTASGSYTSGSSGYRGMTGMGSGATHGYTYNNYYRQYSAEEVVEAFVAGWNGSNLMDEKSPEEIAKEYLKKKYG